MDIKRTCRDVNELLPEVQEGLKYVVEECKRRGLPILITETYRPQERQDYLYSLGRTREGKKVTWTLNSYHTTRRAFDFCKNVKGQEFSDSKFFKEVADIATSIGFTAGYYWRGRQQDPPHIQLDKGKHLKIPNVQKVIEKAVEKAEEKKDKALKAGGEIVAKPVKKTIIIDDKSEVLDLLDVEGHGYIKIQDLRRFGFKIVKGNDKMVEIKTK